FARFPCYRTLVRPASYRNEVAEKAIQGNSWAPEIPSLPVPGRNRNLAFLVGTLQTASHRYVFVPFRCFPGLRFIFSFALRYGLRFCSANCRQEWLSCGWCRNLAQQ